MLTSALSRHVKQVRAINLFCIFSLSDVQASSRFIPGYLVLFPFRMQSQLNLRKTLPRVIKRPSCLEVVAIWLRNKPHLEHLSTLNTMAGQLGMNMIIYFHRPTHTRCDVAGC